ncbi:hypothetical protein CRE_19484 [Caenorhabditis remanei]|uniref:RING-type domain-containing protein n=1 Tax=Caenorhabditis remanei TaxID=31234 RepID=E3NG63_CAERE|nr:hypothetical protein CRE_19484 [Caenorhabditis remanei]
MFKTKINKNQLKTMFKGILTQCGHTVCEECAWNVSEESYKIKCPVCRQVDDIDEPASRDVVPSAPVEELEDRRPENQILTQCGHTVCEECARKLLGHQGNITCPVCREETRVDWKVENLPMNFAVIGMARGN